MLKLWFFRRILWRHRRGRRRSAPPVNCRRRQVNDQHRRSTPINRRQKPFFWRRLRRWKIQTHQKKNQKQGRKLPATLQQKQRSFVEVLQQKQQQTGWQQDEHKIEFSLKGVVEREGFPVVKFKEFEWKKLAEKDECLTLVGRFIQPRPAIDVIRVQFQKLLPVSSLAHVGVIDCRSILLQFSVKEDCERVLMRRHASVDGKLVRFLRWTPDWRRRRSSPIVPA